MCRLVLGKDTKQSFVTHSVTSPSPFPDNTADGRERTGHIISSSWDWWTFPRFDILYSSPIHTIPLKWIAKGNQRKPSIAQDRSLTQWIKQAEEIAEKIGHLRKKKDQ